MVSHSNKLVENENVESFKNMIALQCDQYFGGLYINTDAVIKVLVTFCLKKKLVD